MFVFLIITLIFSNFASAKTQNITQLLSRDWTNQLGSTMSLGVWDDGTDTDKFSIGGIYISGVGEARGKYPLFGSGTSKNGVVVFGWQVVWNNGEINSYSLSSWSAYLNTNTMNEKSPSFYAQWFLTQPGPFSWNSTTIGEDHFTAPN